VRACAGNVRDLALGDNDAKAKAIGAAAASGDIANLTLLQAMLDGEVQTVGDTQVLLVKGDAATDLLTGKAVTPLPGDREDVVINNRIRKELRTAIAALKLTAPERTVRLAAARELQTGADEELLPAIGTALTRKRWRDQGPALADAGRDPIDEQRQEHASGRHTRARRKQQLEHQDTIAGCARAKGRRLCRARRRCPRRGREITVFGSEQAFRGRDGRRVFSGISLGSILAARRAGLAITYGLMGVINMAHGELIMIGAYTTYVVQNFFRSHFPALFDAYLIAAVPAAFVASALVGHGA
jgi:urea transport system permease protein